MARAQTAVVLLLVALAAPAASAAGFSGRPGGGGGGILELAPSQSEPLSSIAGCGGSTIAGNMDECQLEDNIKIGAKPRVESLRGCG